MSVEKVEPGMQDDDDMCRCRFVVSVYTSSLFLKTWHRDSPVTAVEDRKVTVLSIARSGRKAE